MSIPIFTSQLQKARFATNQANARAAKAAAVAGILDETYKPSGDATTVIVKYDAKTGKPDSTAATSASGTAIAVTGEGAKGDVASWQPSDLADLGKKTYYTWYVTVDTNGGVTQYNYAD